MFDYKAVLFDLDGTLVDSMGIWKDIDVEYLGRFHIPMPDGLQEAIEGISMYETATYFKNHFHIKDSHEKMIADWNDMAYRKYTQVPAKNGILRFLEYLEKNAEKQLHHLRGSRILCQKRMPRLGGSGPL